jgi:hypothetical protein
MSEMKIEGSPEEVEDVLRAAVHETNGLSIRHFTDRKLSAKTSVNPINWGEEIVVDIPQNQDDSDGLKIIVTARKRVGINITANENKIKRKFLLSLDEVRSKDIDTIRENNLHEPNEGQIGFFKFAVLAIAAGFGMFTMIVLILLLVTQI